MSGPGEEGGDGEPEDSGTVTRRAARLARVRLRRRAVALGAGAMLVVLLAFVLWYELESHALGPRGPQVVVTVHDGESTGAVIDDLSHKGVISSSLAFKIYDVFHGDPSVRPGSYALFRNLAFSEAHALLAGGPNVTEIDVRPGYTLAEVAQKVGLAAGHTPQGFEKVAASGAVRSGFSPPGSDNLEGMLGTGTYLVFPGESDLSIVREMVTRFDRDAQGAGLSTASAGALGFTPYEAVIVASVVEKEGYIAANMPDVARVIDNRLAQHMALQMDSTILYALGQDGGAVTAHDLTIVSPYNSYLNKGLPPTPICMPSATALAATLHPPAGAWLYFVLVQKNGIMAFADTYAEQLANEQLAKSRGLP